MAVRLLNPEGLPQPEHYRQVAVATGTRTVHLAGQVARDADGTPVSLSSFRGRRVIVYCYPAALTPGCTTQAVDFTAAAGDLAEAGLDIIGVSPDVPEKLSRFREQEELSITLVSDPEKQVLTAYGAYGPKKLYGKEVVGVIRSTFVVDADGRIEKAAYNVKATGHVAKLRRDLGLD